MTICKSLMTGAMATLLFTGAAFAQAAPAAPATPPAAAAPAPMAAGGMDKKAISKACSDEATQQGLHGKARKTYRSKCKMTKMKGM